MNQKTVKLIKRYNQLMGYPEFSLKKRLNVVKKDYKKMNWKDRTKFNKSLSEQI
jgi:hypothetical protein